MRHFAVAAAVLLSPVLAGAQNLVTNGGFETGDLSGFTYTYVTPGEPFVLRDDGYAMPHTGQYVLAIGAEHLYPTVLTQSIATTPGTSYLFSFWGYGYAGYGALKFGGVTVGTTGPSLRLDATYREFAGLATATGTSTLLTFTAFNEPSYSFFDDISVTAVTTAPEPSTVALTLGGGLAALGAGAWRRWRSASWRGA